MLAEPVAGFVDSFESNYRTPEGKVFIDSHYYLASTVNNGGVIVNSSNAYAQNFTLTTGTTSNTFEFFISRSGGIESDINVRLLADSGGSPDNGTVLASGSIFSVINERPRWYACNFGTTVTLLSGVKYWIELSCVGDTALNWYKNTNVVGNSYAQNISTITNGQSLIFKLKSTTLSNLYELPYLLSYSLSSNERLGSDSGAFKLLNIDNIYDEAQPVKHLILEGSLISTYIGNGSNTLQLNQMIIDSNSNEDSYLDIKVIGKYTKLINQNVLFKSEYIGTDFGNVIKDIIKQNPFFKNEDLTGIPTVGFNFPSTGTLEGTLSDAIEKIVQAISYDFKFSNTGKPVIIAKKSTFNSQFTLDQSKHILRNNIQVNESTKNIFNRLQITNGITSDGNDVEAAAASKIGTYTGSLTSAQRSLEVIINYVDAPIVFSEVVNNSTNDTVLREKYRATDALVIEVLNINYPNNSASYNFDIFGSQVSNKTGNTLISEKLRWTSSLKEGLIDYRISNNLFLNAGIINKLLDRLLLFNSVPREFFNVQTKGIPTIENGDIVKFSLDGINPQFIYKITSQNISYDNQPRRYTVNYTCEKYPFLDGTSIRDIFLYADDGYFADAGFFADSELNAEQNTYA